MPNSPYDFQRLRHRLGEYPRTAQPNTNQPNRKNKPSGWGTGTSDYWGSVMKTYRNRRK